MLTVQEFIEQYEDQMRLTPEDEILALDVYAELMSLVAQMFQVNCGKIPNFTLTNNGKRITLL